MGGRTPHSNRYLTCPLQDRSPQSSIGCQVGRYLLFNAFTHLCVVSSVATGVDGGLILLSCVLGNRWIGVRYSRGTEFVTASTLALGVTQTTQWVHGAVILRVRQLEREAGHLPPTKPKVTKEWRHVSTVPTSWWRKFTLYREGESNRKINRKSNFPGIHVLFNVCLIIAYFICLTRRSGSQIWTGHEVEGDSHGIIMGTVF